VRTVAHECFFTRKDDNLGCRSIQMLRVRPRTMHLIALLLIYAIRDSNFLACLRDPHKDTASRHEVQLDATSILGNMVHGTVLRLCGSRHQPEYGQEQRQAKTLTWHDSFSWK